MTRVPGATCQQNQGRRARRLQSSTDFPQGFTHACARVTAMINKPLETIKVEMQLRVPGGCSTLSIPLTDVPRYNADPDGYAGALFGLSRDQYCEWVQSDGVALCGARNARGKPCGNMVGGGIQLSAEQWSNIRRSEYCSTHAGLHR